jgi:hypothetical protein
MQQVTWLNSTSHGILISYDNRCDVTSGVLQTDLVPIIQTRLCLHGDLIRTCTGDLIRHEGGGDYAGICCVLEKNDWGSRHDCAWSQTLPIHFMLKLHVLVPIMETFKLGFVYAPPPTDGTPPPTAPPLQLMAHPLQLTAPPSNCTRLSGRGVASVCRYLGWCTIRVLHFWQ